MDRMRVRFLRGKVVIVEVKEETIKKKTKRTKDEAQNLLLNEPDDDSTFNDIMFDGTAEDPIVLE